MISKFSKLVLVLLNSSSKDLTLFANQLFKPFKLLFDMAGVSRKAIELNLVDSLDIRVKKVKMNMLQFANDILFFCEANIKSVFTK